MAVHITLKIKKNPSREKIQKDVENMLTRFANWAPILNCPGGMDLLVTHNYGDDKIHFFFSRFNPKTERGIKLTCIDCYVWEINQLLVRMKLINDYQVCYAYVGESRITLSDGDKCFYIKKHSSELKINEYVARCPGIKVRLRLHDNVNISQNHMLEDANKLLLSLNDHDKENLVVQTDHEPFVGFPVVFLSTEQRSIDIGFIASGILGYMSYLEKIMKAVNEYLKHVDLDKKYSVSQIMSMPDITVDQTTTHNQSMLARSTFKQSDVPAKYLCALTNQLMDDAVIIPGFDGRVEKAVIVRIITASGKNPFNNQPMTIDDLKPDDPLIDEIYEFVTKITKEYSPDKKLKKPDALSQIMNASDITVDQAATTLNQSMLARSTFKQSDVPAKYLCALTNQLMDDAVIIPGFDGRVEKAVITRIIAASGKNPFNNQPITIDDLEPDDPLIDEIYEFVTKITKEYSPDKKSKKPDVLQPLSSILISVEHYTLIELCRRFKSQQTQTFFDALLKCNYTQALRRVSTSTSDDAIELLKTLLNFKQKLRFNIDDQNKDDRSALHFAAMKNNKRAYNILLQNGADDSILDKDKKTPRDYAQANGLVVNMQKN